MAIQPGIYIDIPTRNCIDNDEGYWEHVHIAPTLRDAVKWIRKNFGECDDDGKVCLLMNRPHLSKYVVEFEEFSDEDNTHQKNKMTFDAPDMMHAVNQLLDFYRTLDLRVSVIEKVTLADTN